MPSLRHGVTQVFLADFNAIFRITAVSLEESRFLTKGVYLIFGNYVHWKARGGQAIADNLDIVVVSLGEEGTLKRFSKMGNNAIQLAENPKYDPILLNDDQVNILGLAVGVIKSGNRN